MLKRKFFIKHDNESNEQFETRVNNYLNEVDKSFTSEDQTGHSFSTDKDGNLFFITYVEQNDSKKSKVGF